MHENRETSLVSAEADRSGKANNHKPDAYAREESDCAIVPVKRLNKEASVSAEVVEGRAQTKENDAGPGTSPTRSGERVSQGLGGVRQVAREREQERFKALLHHLTVDPEKPYRKRQPRPSPTRSGERVSQGLGGVRQVARERKQERFTALLHHLTVDLERPMSSWCVTPSFQESRTWEICISVSTRGRARRSLWAVTLSPTLPARYGAVSVSEQFPGSTEFRGQGTGPDQPFESLRCVGPIGGRVIVFHPGAAFGLGIGCAGLGEDDFVFPGGLALGTLGLLALPRIGRRAIAVRIVRRNGA